MSSLTVRNSKGFTLVELLVAVAIISMIAVLGIPAFQSFLKKAKMVEAENALSEIKRLEDLYFGTNLAYSSDLAAIGWNPTTPLKYYAITVQLNGAGPPPFLYRITAIGNLDSDPDLDVWRQTMDTSMVAN